MKKILLMIMVMFLLVACKEEIKDISLVTGGTGGTYFPLGNGIAEILTDDPDSDYIVSAFVSTASLDNSHRIGNEEIQMAFVQNNVAFRAVNGFDMFEEQPVANMRGIATLYPEVIQIVVTEASGINSIEDLKGMRVSMGDIGSGNYFDAINIIKAYGISLDEITVFEYQSQNAINAMEAGAIDAVFITSALPNDIIERISAKVPIKLISLSDDMVEMITQAEPYLSPAVIKAGTYLGSKVDITTLQTEALWVCTASMDDDVVYDLTKIFWKNQKKLESKLDSIEFIDINTALKRMSIEMHPGAQRYYDELEEE